ncbi:MAG: hypothetical protein DHS20C15_19090 [Planctomycetota bacterium]|nr:MAG: hypothetical protein DHS20C15_19090 [Planctomycetota bacterium]
MLRGVSQSLGGPWPDSMREVASILLMAVTIFVGLACLSAGRGDNLCGPAGEGLANLLLGTFGYASWLAVFCFGLWAAFLFLRREQHSVSVRATGLLLSMVSLSALLTHFLGDAPGRFPAGGMLGESINYHLQVSLGFGVVGTRIALLAFTVITVGLATDIVYYAVLATGLQRAGELKTKLRDAAVTRGDKPGKSGKADKPDKRKNKPKRGAGKRAAVVEDELEDEELADDEEWEDEEELAADEGADADDAEDEEYEDDDVEDGEELEADDETDELADDEEWEDEVEEDDDSVAPEDLEEEDWAEGEEEEPEDDDEAFEDDISGDSELERAARAAPMVRQSGEGQLDLGLDPDGPRPVLNRAKVSDYVFPSDDLLDEQEAVDQRELDALLADKTEVLESTLKSFKIEARVVEIQKGPVISMFEMELAPGIKVEKLRSLEDDLAIALRTRTVRIVAPIPGKNTVGIEVPNPIRENVRLKALLHVKEFDDGKQSLPIFLGRDAAGRPMVVDLAKMPHLLVAGATGSGKSVCLNTIICSFLFTRTPEQVKLVLLDPKMVEMSQFENAPHLACPVVNDMKRAPGILEWAVNKMEDRYRLLSRAGVRNIHSFNKLGEDRLREKFGEIVDTEDFPRFLPFIVIVVDELADLMMVAAKDVEASITRLAAKSRAVGIHIILATQRPSTNVITGLIKANLPTRVAFMVSSKIDSRVILDVNGAEQLLGQGDMLFLPPNSSNVVRGQCTFMSEDEVRLVMDAVRTDQGPEYEKELVQRRDENAPDPSDVDELYDPAARFIIGTQRGSASLLQRKFAIGYTRASRLIDLMAEEGLLGEYKGSQAREVQMSLEEWVGLNPEARESEEEEQAY